MGSHPSDLNILEVLNDDCLLEIFRHLDLETLIIADQVCSRFRELAHSIYSRYHNYEIHIRTERNLSGKILARIGPYLDSLLFSCGYLIVPTRIIKSISRHCPNLTKLKLQYLTLGDVDLTLLEDIFENLQDLDISCVRISHIHTGLPFVLNGPKLKRLRLHFFENKCEESFLYLVSQNPKVKIEKFPHSLVN